MSSKKAKKSGAEKMGIIIPLLLGGLFGAGLGIGMGLKDEVLNQEKDFGRGLLEITVLLLMFTITYLVHIIIHEAGHLVFGLLSGYKFVSFRVGSFTIIKEDGTFKLKKFKIPGTGGQCIMMPPNVDIENCPNRLYNAGGVLLNVISSTIIVVFLCLFSFQWYLQLFLITFCIAGYLVASSNGIPMKVSGVANDGYNIYLLNKFAFTKKSFYISLKTMGELSKGKRYKDLPLEWFLLEGADFKNHLAASMKISEGNWYLDRHEFEKARECFEFLLQPELNVIELYKNELKCEILFIELVTKQEKEVIEELYTKKLKKYIKATNCYVSRKRLMYAYYKLIEKDLKKAEKELNEFEKVKNTYPVKGEILMEQDLINYVKKI